VQVLANATEFFAIRNLLRYKQLNVSHTTLYKHVLSLPLLLFKLSLSRLLTFTSSPAFQLSVFFKLILVVYILPFSSFKTEASKKMVSFLTLEINLVMIPVLTLFLLYCVPISAVANTAERLTRLIENHNLNGLTAMAAMAIISSFSFLFNFLEWQSKYAKKEQFVDISLQLQHDNKRLRVERNMYIHLTTCVLCLAVKKCAALLRQRDQHAAPLPAAVANTVGNDAVHAKSN
jgi:hypothetical protein